MGVGGGGGTMGGSKAQPAAARSAANAPTIRVAKSDTSEAASSRAKRAGDMTALESEVERSAARGRHGRGRREGETTTRRREGETTRCGCELRRASFDRAPLARDPASESGGVRETRRA